MTTPQWNWTIKVIKPEKQLNHRLLINIYCLPFIHAKALHPFLMFFFTSPHTYSVAPQTPRLISYLSLWICLFKCRHRRKRLSL